MKHSTRRLTVERPSVVSISLLAAAAILAACGGGSDSAGGSGAAPGAPSLSVGWVHAQPCVPGTPSSVTLTLNALDDVDAEVDLVFSGNVTSCGPLTQKSNVVSCPQAAPYGSFATVTDLDGNARRVDFTVGVCSDGTAP